MVDLLIVAYVVGQWSSRTSY